MKLASHSWWATGQPPAPGQPPLPPRITPSLLPTGVSASFQKIPCRVKGGYDLGDFLRRGVYLLPVWCTALVQVVMCYKHTFKEEKNMVDRQRYGSAQQRCIPLLGTDILVLCK